MLVYWLIERSGIYQMGFNRPSKIQETALPMLVSQQPQNLIAQSQSGTGKTAAFVLTMLSRIDTRDDTPQCLCLSPTFEVWWYKRPLHRLILACSANRKSSRSDGCRHARLENLLCSERDPPGTGREGTGTDCNWNAGNDNGLDCET